MDAMNMKYCTHCGTGLSKESNFCSSCGQQQAAPALPPVPTFTYSDNRPHSNITTHVPEDGSLETHGTVEFGDLHPNAIWLFFIQYLGRTALLLPLLAMGIFVEPLLAPVAIVYVGGHYVVARLMYKNFRFEVAPHALTKEYGIIHKRSATIPFEQIENVNINRNMIDRMLGMSHLEIETAGNSGTKSKSELGGMSWSAEGYLPGLAAGEAEDLKHLMLLRARDHS